MILSHIWVTHPDCLCSPRRTGSLQGLRRQGEAAERLFPPLVGGMKEEQNCHEFEVGAQRRFCGGLEEGGGVFGAAHCPCSECSVREETAAGSCRGREILPRPTCCSWSLPQFPPWAGDTSLSLVLPFPSEPPPSASWDPPQGSGLAVVSLKDTELSSCVTLFKCLIKLNLAWLDQVMYLWFFLSFFSSFF